MKLFDKIKRFSHLKGLERILYLKGIGIVIVFTFLINLFPLRSFIGLLYAKSKNRSFSDQKKQNINLVKKTLKRLEKNLPFKLSCFIKTVTFKLLLNSLGVESKIELGVCKSPSYLLRAHAYLIVDERIIYLRKQGYTALQTIG